MERLKKPGPYQVRLSAVMRERWVNWCRRAGVKQAPAVEAAFVAYMADEDKISLLRAKLRREVK